MKKPRLMCVLCKEKPVRKLSTNRVYAHQWFCSIRCAADAGLIHIAHTMQFCEIGNHFFCGSEGDSCFDHESEAEDATCDRCKRAAVLEEIPLMGWSENWCERCYVAGKASGEVVSA